jgi:uncharacterized protein (TIGR03086 family)
MESDILGFHAQAGQAFGALVAAVGAGQWGARTPCPEWDVRDLVDHVVRGNLAAVQMLDGVALTELAALDLARPDFDVLGSDPRAAWQRSDTAAVEAFARPGALGAVVHHPSGDLPGRRFAVMRFTDNLLHGWDLARGIGADPTLDPFLVEAAHGFLAPVAHALPATGYFAAAPEIGPTADRQTQLLAMVGRDAGA